MNLDGYRTIRIANGKKISSITAVKGKGTPGPETEHPDKDDWPSHPDEPPPRDLPDDPFRRDRWISDLPGEIIVPPRRERS